MKSQYKFVKAIYKPLEDCYRWYNKTKMQDDKYAYTFKLIYRNVDKPQIRFEQRAFLTHQVAGFYNKELTLDSTVDESLYLNVIDDIREKREIFIAKEDDATIDDVIKRLYKERYLEDALLGNTLALTIRDYAAKEGI